KRQIMAAVCVAAVFAFAILAIDGAILMTTKTQLQNAADAAALAGASGLISSQELATQRAIEYAAFNRAVRVGLEPVVITEEDVSFPEPDRIRVVTHRTTASGDPLRTYFLRLADPDSPNTADVSAVAVAAFGPICGTDCVKPWAMPDRWDDVNGNGMYDPGEPYDPVITGYMPPMDVGARILLKVGSRGSNRGTSSRSTSPRWATIPTRSPAATSTGNGSPSAAPTSSRSGTRCRSSRATWSGRPNRACATSSPWIRAPTGTTGRTRSRGRPSG
ncbi:MAG: pilus assembly protein TadG-related protein, partial [Candidatus Eisenbacteria bacterium]|nr:pilus assembly protein TadG-related protein [Candidatus Eisenbacteria bacterium]